MMPTTSANPWKKIISVILVLILAGTISFLSTPARAQDGVVETSPLIDPPPADPGQQQVEEGEARNVSHFPQDFESYVPMPLREHSESISTLPEGGFISYDVRTGKETFSETVPNPDLLLMEVYGSIDGRAEGAPGVPLNFSALSQVTNPQDSPYRRSVKIYLTQGGINYVCSGTLIDPLHVITAGHCVHEGNSAGGGTWSTNVVIVPAYENGSRPFGDAAYLELHAWTGWIDSSDLDHDIGIIDLDRPIGALTGWHGYGSSNDCSYFTSGTWRHDGYPAASPYDGQYMYTQDGNFDACDYAMGAWTGNEVSFNLQSYGGQSGTGAYRDNVVRAVVSSGNSSATWDVRITDGKFADIRDTVIADDTPSTFDLIPLDVRTSPGSITAGSQLSSMDFLVHNYSSASRNGMVGFTVYLSTNEAISTTDTSLGSGSFSWNFSSKESVRVSLTTPPTIPIATSSGNYWIGVILNISDANTGNNASDGQDASAITVQSVSVPPAPTNVQATDGAYTGKVGVTWNSAAGATYYEVYRATSSGGSKTKLGSPSAAAWDDTSASAGVAYFYWVTACNISNCSGFSSNDTGWRAATPPANVQASDGMFTDKVRVTWDAAVGAASYEVYRASSAAGSKTNLGSTSATTFDDMATAVGTTYYYWVQACSSPGCSDFSVHDTGWRADTPPANIQASDGTYSDKVRVTWDAAGGATSYEVYRASSAAGSKTNLGSTSATMYDDAMIVVGTTYYYWVTACYTPGCGGYSSHDSGYAGLPAPILISPPESSVVKDMTPTFEWTAPPGAIKFELQVDDNSDFSSPLVEESLTSTSYTLSSVLADGDYYWRVRSNAGSAIWSNYTAAWVVTVDPFKVYLPIIMRP